jgi:phage baseplate assembly protein W
MATIRDIKQFKDIDLMFRVNPFTKDVYTKEGEEAVKTALKHLILTKNFERPFHPEIGTQIHSLLFENFNSASKIAMERSITNAVERYEPRVRLIDVNVRELQDSNDIEVTIVFTLRNVDRPVTLTTLLNRVR